jgi:C1A family cysteine protease
MPKNAHVVKRILNCIQSRDVEKDWRLEDAKGAGLLAEPAIPPSKDLREPWWSVGDQGETGSCVGWATADSVLRWHFVKAGRLAQNELLSVRFIWMASKETDEYTTQPTTFIEVAGTSLKAALDIARKFGNVIDSALPFASGRLYPDRAETFYALAAQLKIASYFNLHQDLNHWKSWLATRGPVLMRLEVDETWDKAMETNGKLDVFNPDTVRGGHAVALVGYTPDRFIVRNSWSNAWGDNGFGYASPAYARAAFTEAYGVVL